MPSSKVSSLLVADTGPLLALARVELTYLPGQLFERCVLTESVLEECLAKPESIDALQIHRAIQNKELICIADPIVRPAFKLLDPGEKTVLELASQRNAYALVDEKRGRHFAKLYTAGVIGSIGILLLAKRTGILPKVKPHITAMVESGYYLGADLVSHALMITKE